MKKTYTGSCHCGAVKFEADLDFEAGSGKCNCSICSKNRLWCMLVKPEDFRLQAEEGAQSDYRFGDVMQHLFCRTCGVHAYEKGFMEYLGGEFYVVNLACLDGVTPEELMEIPVRYTDGRNDDWSMAPGVVGYL